MIKSEPYKYVKDDADHISLDLDEKLE